MKIDIKAFMNKTVASVKNFFKTKTIAFYVAFGMAVLSVVCAIIYAAVFGGLSEYMSWLAFALLLIAAVAFITLSILGYAKLGTVTMAVLDFSALIAALIVSYKYFISFAIGGGISAVFADSAAKMFVVCIVLLLVCCIGSNVAVWLRLNKKQAVPNEN